jgi:hypothetical protein
MAEIERWMRRMAKIRRAITNIPFPSLFFILRIVFPAGRDSENPPGGTPADEACQEERHSDNSEYYCKGAADLVSEIQHSYYYYDNCPDDTVERSHVLFHSGSLFRMSVDLSEQPFYKKNDPCDRPDAKQAGKNEFHDRRHCGSSEMINSIFKMSHCLSVIL